MILGVLGILQIRKTRTTLESNLLLALGGTRETLVVTDTGLDNIQNTLDTIDSNLASLNNTLLSVGQSLNDALPVLDNTSSLLKEDLPATFEATQASLKTAQASAKLLDGVTRAITSIPFYPGEPYNPEVPLDVSLQNVAASLEDIPESLSTLGTDLANNRANLVAIEDNLIALSVTLTGLSTDIDNAKTTLGEYQSLIASALTQIDLLEISLPVTLNALAWFLSILIVWLIFTQVGLIFQGLSLAGIQLFKAKADEQAG